MKGLLLLPSSAWPMTLSTSVHSSISLPPSSRSRTQNLDAQSKSEDKVLTCGHMTKMWETESEFASREAVETIPNTAWVHPPPTHPLPTHPSFWPSRHISVTSATSLFCLISCLGLRPSLLPVASFHTTFLSKRSKSPLLLTFPEWAAPNLCRRSTLLVKEFDVPSPCRHMTSAGSSESFQVAKVPGSVLPVYYTHPSGRLLLY